MRNDVYFDSVAILLLGSNIFLYIARVKILRQLFHGESASVRGVGHSRYRVLAALGHRVVAGRLRSRGLDPDLGEAAEMNPIAISLLIEPPDAGTTLATDPESVGP